MQTFEDFCTTHPGEDLFAKAERLSAALETPDGAAAHGLGLRAAGPVGPRTDLVFPDGRRRSCLMFGSNSYLNLTTHPAVVAGAREALERYGYGAGAVSLYTGATALVGELERRIAAFYGTEDAIVFPGGYAANVGILSALCGPGDVIVNDSENHASIFDGTRLSGAEAKVFLHGRTDHLEKVLARIPASCGGRLIVVDGVFSMSGDLAPLDRIVELARRYGARVMVDDAHGIGVVGPTGRGTAERFGVMGKIDLHVGMLSKAPGGLGGFCAASAAVVRHLRLYARTYFFSTALPPPVAGGLLAAFDLLAADAAGRETLWRNITALRERLAAAGFEIGPGGSGITPLYVGDEARLAAYHAELLEAGLYTNLVSYPACRRKRCRLRICVMKAHTAAEIDEGAETLIRLGRKHGIIR